MKQYHADIIARPEMKTTSDSSPVLVQMLKKALSQNAK
jgi:hypothetical protein